MFFKRKNKKADYLEGLPADLYNLLLKYIEPKSILKLASANISNKERTKAYLQRIEPWEQALQLRYPYTYYFQYLSRNPEKESVHQFYQSPKPVDPLHTLLNTESADHVITYLETNKRWQSLQRPQIGDFNILWVIHRKNLHTFNKVMYEAVVEYFFSKNAIRDCHDNCLAHYMVLFHQQQDLENYLIQYPETALIKNKDGCSVLYFACGAGNEVAVSNLIDAYLKTGQPLDLNHQNNQGDPPVLIAAQNGFLNIVQLLVGTYGAQIEGDYRQFRKNPDGSVTTPLSAAASGDHSEIVTYLINQGAEINPDDSDKISPLTAAASHGHLTLIQDLQETGAVFRGRFFERVDPVWVATSNGRLNVLSYLLNNGCTSNAQVQNEGGFNISALGEAARQGFSDVAKCLIDYGAEVNCEIGFHNLSPLWLAAKHGHTNMVELLVKHKAVAHWVNKGGSTPVKEAARRGDKAMVQCLVEHGARVEALNPKDYPHWFNFYDDSTPLMDAAKNKHQAVVDYLLEQPGSASKERKFITKLLSDKDFWKQQTFFKKSCPTGIAVMQEHINNYSLTDDKLLKRLKKSLPENRSGWSKYFRIHKPFRSEATQAFYQLLRESDTLKVFVARLKEHMYTSLESKVNSLREPPKYYHYELIDPPEKHKDLRWQRIVVKEILLENRLPRLQRATTERVEVNDRKGESSMSFEKKKKRIIKYIKSYRLSEAKSMCEELLRENPHDAEVIFLRGEINYKRASSEWTRDRFALDGAALADFEQAIASKNLPEELLVEAYLKAGNCYRHLGHYDDAVKYFNQSLTLKPQAFTYQLRAQLNKDSGYYLESEQDFKSALALEPNNVHIWFDFAHLFYRQRKFNFARMILDKKVLALGGLSQKGRNLKKSIEAEEKHAGENILQIIEEDRSAQLRQIQDLFNAVATHQHWQIDQLLKPKGIIDVTVLDAQGNTLLHEAARHGHEDLILRFSRQGVSLNAKNEADQTPMMIAVEKGNLSLVELLEGQGANQYRYHTWQRKTLLLLAIEHGHEVLVNYFQRDERLVQQSGGKLALLHHAIRNQQEALITAFLKENPQMVNQFYNNKNALQVAIKSNAHYTIPLLLDYQADPEAQNEEKQSALTFAHESDNEIIRNQLENAKNKLKHIRTLGEKNLNELLQSVHDALKPKSTRYREENRWKKVEPILREMLEDTWSTWSVLCSKDQNLSVLSNCIIAYLEAHKDSIFVHKTVKAFNVEKKVIGYNLNQESLQTVTRRAISDWQRQIAPNKPPALVEQIDDEENNEHKEELPQTKEQDPIDGKLPAFIRRFETRFDEMYRIFWAFKSEQMEYKADNKDKAIEFAKENAHHLPSIPIPTTGLSVPTGSLATAALNLIMYIREHYRGEQARRMVELFSALSPTERTSFIRESAIAIALRYKDQINYLDDGSSGVEAFADCVVDRVVKHITDKDKNQYLEGPSVLSSIRRTFMRLRGKKPPRQEVQRKDLTTLFFEGIIRVQSNDKKEEETLRTGLNGENTSEDHWTSRGILENTGVITSDRKRFANKDSEVERYGYCRGTEEEAHLRTLSEKNSEGGPWPEVYLSLPIQATPTQGLRAVGMFARRTSEDDSTPELGTNLNNQYAQARR